MIFVDTGAWIAISNPKDQHHREAVAIYNDLRHREIQLLTTDYVIDETVTRLRYDTNHSLAVMFLERIELLVETMVNSLITSTITTLLIWHG
jgi:predicted nucleic acid-binding protein